MGGGSIKKKKGARLYLKPMTKAHLCLEAPLAVLMRIKRLWVHSSGLREGCRETQRGRGGVLSGRI